MSCHEGTACTFEVGRHIRSLFAVTLNHFRLRCRFYLNIALIRQWQVSSISRDKLNSSLVLPRNVLLSSALHVLIFCEQ